MVGPDLPTYFQGLWEKDLDDDHDDEDEDENNTDQQYKKM